MDSSQDNLLSNWNELKTHVQQKWNRISDNDLTQLNGHSDELVTILRLHYGFARVQAGIEIQKWLNDLNRDPHRYLRTD